MKVFLVLALIAYAFSASGYAARYWDCCKPSCSWTGNVGVEMKPENVIKTVELFSVIMVLRVLVMVVLQ